LSVPVEMVRTVIAELLGIPFAGHETTVSLIGNAVLVLLQQPDQRAELERDPALIAPAIEELLRYDGPVERALNRWAERRHQARRLQARQPLLPRRAARTSRGRGRADDVVSPAAGAAARGSRRRAVLATGAALPQPRLAAGDLVARSDRQLIRSLRLRPPSMSFSSGTVSTTRRTTGTRNPGMSPRRSASSTARSRPARSAVSIVC
jgi:hypothetical protein